MSTLTVRRARAALGLRVAELREQRGLTQQQLAEGADLSLRYLQKIEAGEGGVSFDALVAVSAGLDVAIGALFQGAAPRPPRSRGRPRRR